jgi:transposase-like protein
MVAVDIVRLIGLYQSGKSTRVVGSELGVDHVTVLNILKKTGTTIRSRVMPRKVSVSEVVEAHYSGLTGGEIATKLGVDKALVYARLKEANVTPWSFIEKDWVSLAVELYEAGMDCPVISDFIGPSTAFIYSELKKSGVKFRSSKACGRNFTKGYAKSFNSELKLKIRTRDNFVCKSCGLTEAENKERIKIQGRGQPLTIHHIDFDKMNSSEDNLITLCIRCNAQANTDREHFKTLYSEKVREILNS